jgi:hypothetical protein
MIKKELIHSASSYWRNNELYNKTERKERILKIFGITISRNIEEFQCDLIDDMSDKIGFKAREKK